MIAFDKTCVVEPASTSTFMNPSLKPIDILEKVWRRKAGGKQADFSQFPPKFFNLKNLFFKSKVSFYV